MRTLVRINRATRTAPRQASAALVCDIVFAHGDRARGPEDLVGGQHPSDHIRDRPVLTYRTFPLSNASYILISLWLTLHTVAVHYTYPKVPLGFWLDQWFHFQRNHFDRIVHFLFGFFFTLPLEEVFRRAGKVKGWLLPYLVVMTILGFSAFWKLPKLGSARLLILTSKRRWSATRATSGTAAGHGGRTVRFAALRGLLGAPPQSESRPKNPCRRTPCRSWMPRR